MSQPQLSPRILELLVSHICHDLVSPVGAISNGIEFIEEMGASATKDAMGLIGSSVSQASTALQCFRLCYGAAGSGSNMTYDEIHKTYKAYIEGGRLQLKWDINPMGGGEYPLGFMKVALNAIVMAGNTVSANGTLTVEDHPAGQGIHIKAEGDRVGFKDGVEDAFNHKTSDDDLNPRTVHAYMTRVFADFFGVKIDYDISSDQSLSMSVTY